MNPVKVGAVILTTLILQVSLFSKFSYDGARPDLMVLLAIAAGFVAGPDRGAIVGFASGLAIDVLLATPFGLSALVYTIVGYLVGAIGGTVLRASWWIGPVVVALASAVAMVLYALVGELVGVATLDGAPLTAIVVVVGAVNLALAPVAIRALTWSRTDDRDRSQVFFAR